MQIKPDQDAIASQLLSDIEKFLAETGMSDRAFAQGAGLAHRFVGRLRLGVEPRSSTITACYDFMSKHRKGK